jgi:hypothetical protein
MFILNIFTTFAIPVLPLSHQHVRQLEPIRTISDSNTPSASDLKQKSLNPITRSHICSYFRSSTSTNLPSITAAASLIVKKKRFLSHAPNINTPQHTSADLCNLFYGVGNFRKIRSACQQHEIQYTE